jgi:ribosomal protein L29
MFHPLEEDLSKLSDSEVEQRVQDLSKKYFAAQRLGKPELLTQVATFVTIYREEMSRRYREKTRNELDGDLDQLINVNR